MKTIICWFFGVLAIAFLVDIIRDIWIVSRPGKLLQEQTEETESCSSPFSPLPPVKPRWWEIFGAWLIFQLAALHLPRCLRRRHSTLNSQPSTTFAHSGQSDPHDRTRVCGTPITVDAAVRKTFNSR